MEILDFLAKYWAIICGFGAMIWVLIQMFFNQKSLKKEMAEMKTQLDHHDAEDKKMKEELIGLIDRNKLATEKESNDIKTQLNSIQTSLAVVNNNLNLIISDKIKT